MKVDRKPHALRENHSVGYPKNIIFFDVESRLNRDGEKIIHTPYLFIGYRYYKDKRIKKGYSEEWFYTDNADDFWSWVCSKVYRREKLYMFAHNPTYDIVAGQGFPYLRKKGYDITRFYEKGRTFILEFRKDDRAIVVLNVGNFYQGTVKQIGEAFGLPKLELDYEDPTLEEALPYCKRDVEIIAKAMLTWINFCRDYELGHFGLTAPKQAFNAFRHKFMHHKIYLHDNEEADTLERECYYGGRTEAFYIGYVKDDTIYTLDVNSMYPYVMHEFKYPTALVCVRNNLSVEGLKEVMKHYLVCAKVKVKVNIPCLPVRINKRLVFPVGEFITYLSTPEIELALKYGNIEEVYQVCIYTSAPLFVDYVEFFYNERLKAKADGNKVKDLLFKLMLNSLYGKFGQKGGEWEIIGHTDREGCGYEEVYNVTDGKWHKYKWFNGILMYKGEDKEGYDSFPAIAAHVTGYARKKLFEYIMSAGYKNVYYCDTDSLFVNKEGLDKLSCYIDKTRLGCLKNEGEKKNLCIFGAKDYIWNDGEKHKGVPKTAIKLSINKWKYIHWPRISTLIRHNSIDKYFNIDMIKELKRQYLKGWVTKTGRVVPFELCVSDNENKLLLWEDTTYYKNGLNLINPVQKEWVIREFKI